MAVGARDVRRQALGAEAAATIGHQATRGRETLAASRGHASAVDPRGPLRTTSCAPSLSGPLREGSTTKKWDVRERVCARATTYE